MSALTHTDIHCVFLSEIMLETRNVRAGQAAQYYGKDNYAQRQSLENTSQWLGKGSYFLHLRGTVQQNDLESILSGQSPKGEPLRSRGLVRDGYRDRAALDCVFAAPKSVSLLALVADKTEVADAHQTAITNSLRVMEQRFAQTRIRFGGPQQVVHTGNLTIATFRHDTSRELDPHLHTHCLLMNCTQVRDKWYSLRNDEIHRNKKWLGMLYQHELAVGLRQIGYEIELKPHGQFEVSGFQPEHLNYFSKRKQQILSCLEPQDRWAERENIKSLTRAPKGKPILRTDLLNFWQFECAQLGIEFPHPCQEFVPAPCSSEIAQSIGKASPDFSLEAIEAQYFQTAPVPFAEIEVAIALAIPTLGDQANVVALRDNGQLNLDQLRQQIRQGQPEQSIHSLQAANRLMVSENPLEPLLDDWLALPQDLRSRCCILAPQDTERAVLIERIRKCLQSQGEWGPDIPVIQIFSKSSAELQPGDVIVPERNYRRRNLVRDRFYTVLDIDPQHWLLQDPYGNIYRVKSGFKCKAYSQTVAVVAEWEPLIWTKGDRNNGRKCWAEFAIAATEDKTALIQYPDAQVASLDLSQPLPVDSAIALRTIPPNRRFEQIFVLAGEPFDLQGVLNQAKADIKLYAESVELLTEHTITFMAKSNPVFAQRQIIRQALQEDFLGQPGSLEQFQLPRTEHRPTSIPLGIDFEQLSRNFATAVWERCFQQHDRTLDALRRTVDALERTNTELQCANEQLKRAIARSDAVGNALVRINSDVERSIVRIRAKRLARGIQNRQTLNAMSQTLVPQLTESVHQLQNLVFPEMPSFHTLTAAMQDLQKKIGHFTKGVLHRHSLKAAAAIRTVLVDFKIGHTLADGSLQFESRSLKYRLSGQVVSVCAKDGRGELLKAEGSDILVCKLSLNDVKIFTGLIVKVKHLQQQTKQNGPLPGVEARLIKPRF